MRAFGKQGLRSREEPPEDDERDDDDGLEDEHARRRCAVIFVSRSSGSSPGRVTAAALRSAQLVLGRRRAPRSRAASHARSAVERLAGRRRRRAPSPPAPDRPSVRRTATKCRGLRISASASSEYVIGAPSRSLDASATSAASGRAGIPLPRRDQARRDGVRRLERQPVIAHERVGQLGQRRPAVAGARLEPLGVEFGGRHRRGDELHGRASRRGTSRRRAAAGRPRCRRCRRTACCGRRGRWPAPGRAPCCRWRARARWRPGCASAA